MQLVVGRIGRPHGVRGELTVEVHTDSPEGRFFPGAVLETAPAGAGPLTVSSARWANGRLLLGFESASDRTAAEALRGVLLVAESSTSPPPEDPEEFWDHQLVDLTAETVAGDVLGTVAEVLHLPGGDVLAIRRPAGADLLVPFVAAMVPEVDIAGRRVVIDPPEGLIDLAGE